MALKLVTPPALELITLEEAKVHLRLGLDEHPEDVLISALCTAAREWCEREYERAFITQTWDYTRDDFPDEVAIPLTPVQYVESIGVKDSGGVVTTTDFDGSPITFEDDDYLIDVASTQARIIRKSGTSTIAVAGLADVLTVRVVAGYGDLPMDVPGKFVAATLLMLSHLYEHRGDENVEVPNTVRLLLGQGAIYPMP